MTEGYNRRIFIGLTLAGGLAVSADLKPSLLSFLTHGDVEERVFRVLREHFGLVSEARPVVAAFVTSLRESARHIETPQAFAALLADHAEADAFDTYVLQEFVVSTNFLALRAGHASRLEMLPA